MTNRLFLYFSVLSLCVPGCLTRNSVEVVRSEMAQPIQQEAPPMIAELELWSGQIAYQANEPIPLQITINIGKFNLLVPYTTVEGNGAFTGLIVKDTIGKVISPELAITMASHRKTLMRDGKAVDCVQGADLKAGKSSVPALEDLRNHYALVPGDYTLQVFMTLDVYREVLENQSAQIVEMQRDIAAIQASRHSNDAKQEAIRRLREDIAAIQGEQEGTLTHIYLPLDSRRGATNLESNIVTLTVE